MNFGVMADIHLLERSPENRKDKCAATCLKKFEWMMDQAQKNGCAAVLVPGDLFDSAMTSFRLVGKVAAILLKYPNVALVCAPGQHDMRYHTKGLNNTPMGLLEAAGLLFTASTKVPVELGDVQVWGCGWGDEHLLKTISPGPRDVLIIHKTITTGQPLFPGHTGWSGAKAFLNKYDFNFVMSGDNHQRIIAEVDGKLLVNSGPMMRLTKLLLDYQPMFTIISTDDGIVTELEFPIEPSSDVFDLNKIEMNADKKKKTKELEALVRLVKSENVSVSFKETLNMITQAASTPKDIMAVLDDIMERASGKHNS